MKLFTTALLLALFSALSPAFAEDATSLTPKEREILDRGEVSTGAYVGGGIVGTVLGVGIGQAIHATAPS